MTAPRRRGAHWSPAGVTIWPADLRAFLRLNFGWDVYDWHPDDIQF